MHYTTCDLCDKSIHFSELHNSVLLNDERALKNNEKVYIEIKHSECILTLCKSCGLKINKEALKRAIRVSDQERSSILAELTMITEVN